MQLLLSSQGSAQAQLPPWRPSVLPPYRLCCTHHPGQESRPLPPDEHPTSPRGERLPFLSPTRHLGSPLVEIVLRVVQPQANGYRVALPALSENVVHSSVPALSPPGWGSLGTVERSRGRGEPQTLSPEAEKCLRRGWGSGCCVPSWWRFGKEFGATGGSPTVCPRTGERGESGRERGCLGGGVSRRDVREHAPGPSPLTAGGGGSSGALFPGGGDPGSFPGAALVPTRNLGGGRGGRASGRGRGCSRTHRDSGWRSLLRGTPVRPRPPSGPAPPLALRCPRGPPFLPPPCPSSPPGLELDGFRRRAGRSSRPRCHCLVSGSVRSGSWSRSRHVGRRGHPAAAPAPPRCLRSRNGPRRPP